MSKRQKKSACGGQVRIIGGQWRGRRLNFPELDGLRPSGDRLRETLFNWLQEDLPGAHCLDLFAGSGALGFEAASRRAARVVLVEQDIRAVNALRQHRDTLAANSVEIIHQDALSWLETSNPADRAFNIVFLDPPFASTLLGKALQILEERPWLAPEALIYSESPVDQPLDNPFGPGWHLHRQRHFGAVDSRLYRHR